MQQWCKKQLDTISTWSVHIENLLAFAFKNEAWGTVHVRFMAFMFIFRISRDLYTKFRLVALQCPFRVLVMQVQSTISFQS